MSSIVLGKHEGHNVKVDIPTLLSSRLLVTANSGGGKTVTLKRLVEQAFGHIQIIIIDPEGEFSPLREKYPFVIVGKGGDVAADIKTANLLAHRLLEHRLSAICDIYEMRPADRHAFVAAFCTALVEAPKSSRHPCLVIVDEAHIFAPEKGESIALQPIADVASRGRKRLLCLICATQRLAALSKMVTSLLQNRLIGAMFEDVDLKRAAENLGISPGADYRAFASQLRMLEPGTFWAIGRAITKERILFKVGEIETSHGEQADKYSVEPPPPPEKILALLEKFKDLPKEAEERIKTESQLRQEIRTLHAELRKANLKIAPVSTVTKEVKIVDEQAIRKAVDTVEKSYRQSERALLNRIKFLTDAINNIAVSVAKVTNHEPPQIKPFEVPEIRNAPQRNLPDTQPHRTEIKPHPPQHAETRTTAGMGAESNGDLSGPQKRILKALAELESIGKDRPPREMVAGWSSYSATSGSFANTLSSLNTAGFISYPEQGSLSLTDQGRSATPTVETPDQDEIRRRIENICSGPERKVLGVLIDNGESELTKQEVSERTGYSVDSGSFANTLSSLKTKGLLTYPRTGSIKPAEWIFAV